MSMDNTSTTTHADASSTLVTAAPLAIGGWVKTTKAQFRHLFSIYGPTANDIMALTFAAADTTGDMTCYISQSTPAVSAQSINTSAITDNVWAQGVAGFLSNFTRDVWINGGGKVTKTGVINPSGLATWIMGGRLGDHTQNISGLSAHFWVARNGLDDVEKQFIGLGGHVRYTAVTNYYKLNRVVAGQIPDEIGTVPLTVTGTFTLGVDDPDVASIYLGANIGNQSWQQNSPIVSVAVSSGYDTVNAPFTLGLMRVAQSSSLSTTTTASNAVASRIVPIASVTGFTVGGYVSVAGGTKTRVLAVYPTGTAPAGKLLIATAQMFALGATITFYTASTSSVAGVTFGNNIAGTPTGTQTVTGEYFMRSTNVKQPANLSLTADSNLFSITIVALPVAPVFSVAPGLAGIQSDGYTVGFTPNTTCTAYQMVLAAGSAQPTAAVLKAQATGLAKATKVVTGADSLVTSGLDFPIGDIWTILSNGLGDSPVVGLLSRQKAPPPGKTYRTFTSVDAATRYATNITIGDIEETDLVLSPSVQPLTYLPDGNESYVAGDGRQLRVSRTYNVAAKGWYLDSIGSMLANVWYNDTPPVFVGVSSLFVIALNTPVSIDLSNLFTSIDVLVITAVDALPAGLSIVNRVLVGQVSANVNRSFAILATDVAQVGTLGSFGLIAGTIKAPSLIFLEYHDAISVLTADHLKNAISFIDDTGPPNIVLGQDPPKNADVNPFAIITLTVSKTPAGTVPYYGLRNHSFQIVPQADGDLDLSDPLGT